MFSTLVREGLRIVLFFFSCRQSRVCLKNRKKAEKEYFVWIIWLPMNDCMYVRMYMRYGFNVDKRARFGMCFVYCKEQVLRHACMQKRIVVDWQRREWSCSIRWMGDGLLLFMNQEGCTCNSYNAQWLWNFCVYTERAERTWTVREWFSFRVHIWTRCMNAHTDGNWIKLTTAYTQIRMCLSSNMRKGCRRFFS